MTHPEERRPPRDEEEAAAFKELGRAVTTLREQSGMSRDELASECEMTRDELEEIELGRIDEWWGGLRRVAAALDMSFTDLMQTAPGLALDPGDQGGEPSPARSDANRAGTARSNPGNQGEQA